MLRSPQLPAGFFCAYDGTGPRPSIPTKKKNAVKASGKSIRTAARMNVRAQGKWFRFRQMPYITKPMARATHKHGATTPTNPIQPMVSPRKTSTMANKTPTKIRIYGYEK